MCIELKIKEKSRHGIKSELYVIFKNSSRDISLKEKGLSNSLIGNTL